MSASLNEASPLARYGHNLTALARQGAFTPLLGQEQVVERMFQVLLRGNKNNPMLLDFDEARRIAVVIEAVRRMAAGEAPDPLSQKQVIALDPESLFANLFADAALYHKQIEQVRTRLLRELAESKHQPDARLQKYIEQGLLQPEPGEWIAPIVFYGRLQALFAEVRQAAGTVVLFIDNFHFMVGAGEAEKAIDIANILVPALARRQVQLIGTSTLEMYRRYVERDAALQRRFQEIMTLEAKQEYFSNLRPVIGDD